ncbi:MAG: hypothetical protein OHK0032_16210 [Thermodesulfovibrionales bacterium]
MPVYEYECSACGKQHEVIQRPNDMPLLECPDCGGHMKKLISQTSFVLKGTGWYATDYASGERKKAMEVEKNGVSKKETKSETTSETAKA